MPRLRRINVAGYPYFATTRVHEGRPVFNEPANAEIVLSALYHLRSQAKYFLLGFVIMPNHIHLVVQPRGEETMSSVMQSVKGYASWAINKMTNRRGRLWQSGFYDYALETEEKLLRRIDYMHNNPVRQGLVEKASDYRYSSAHAANATDLEMFQ